MEQDRFDQLAKKVFSSSSRRRVVGGAIASVVGAGVAAVTGASAKGDKGKAKGENKKAKGENKKGKGKTRGEFLCTAANANTNVACNTVTCSTSQDCVAAGCNPPFCVGGVCAGGGNTNTACPAGSCCLTTPAGSGRTCVTAGLQTGTQTCGDPAAGGGGVCRTCPAGTRCSGETGNANTRFRCICDSVTCGNGCCIQNTGTTADQCVQNGTGSLINSSNPAFNGASVCGTGGGTCNLCSTPGGLTFRGCCGATGTCEQGTSTPNCGTNGNVCTNCSTQNAASTCVAQACTVVPTTAAPTTAAPTTAAPTTTIAPCAAGTVRCGTAVPAVCCKKCNGKNTGCKKKRRKKN